MWGLTWDIPSKSGSLCACYTTCFATLEKKKKLKDILAVCLNLLNNVQRPVVHYGWWKKIPKGCIHNAYYLASVQNHAGVNTNYMLCIFNTTSPSPSLLSCHLIKSYWHFTSKWKTMRAWVACLSRVHGLIQSSDYLSLNWVLHFFLMFMWVFSQTYYSAWTDYAKLSQI